LEDEEDDDDDDDELSELSLSESSDELELVSCCGSVCKGSWDGSEGMEVAT